MYYQNSSEGGTMKETITTIVGGCAAVVALLFAAKAFITRKASRGEKIVMASTCAVMSFVGVLHLYVF